MGIQKETADLLLLLSGLSSDQSQIKEIYLERIQESAAYKLTQQLDDYVFISKKAQQLREDIKTIYLERSSFVDIQKEYAKLERLYQHFEELRSTSQQQLNRGGYELELTSKAELKELKKSNPDQYHKIQIVMNSKDAPIEVAFRNYLKTHREPWIMQEYELMRTNDLRERDEKRAIWMRWGGAAIGALLLIVVMKLLMPIATNVELGIIAITLILFIVGLFNVHTYLRMFSISLIAGYAVLLIALTFLEAFHHLPATFHFEQLRELHILFQMAFIGGLVGFGAGSFFNYLPAPSVEIPRFLQAVERRLRFLAIASALFGTVWTLAFKDNMNIYTYAESAMLNHLGIGINAIPASTKENEKKSKIKGKVTVMAKAAYVRTEPVVNDNTIYTAVEKGAVLNYYEVKKVDGEQWYLILEPQSKEKLWIHGTTVKKK